MQVIFNKDSVPWITAKYTDNKLFITAVTDKGHGFIIPKLYLQLFKEYLSKPNNNMWKLPKENTRIWFDKENYKIHPTGDLFISDVKGNTGGMIIIPESIWNQLIGFVDQILRNQRPQILFESKEINNFHDSLFKRRSNN